MKSEQVLDRRSFLSRGTGTLAASFLMGGMVSETQASPQRAEAATTSGTTVQTSVGKIRGALREKIYSFKGVPYGASTAGAGRFMAPSKPQPWTGVRDTLELGLRSPQHLGSGNIPEWMILNRTEPMGEDCLNLNVWTNSLSSTSKKPVMVWLHGGGLSRGSAGWYVYDGTELARKHDVVVVGVNHRLDGFGFLYLGELDQRFADSGNPGIRDIVTALEWVRDNITAFGGDPNNVTIFGQSGGGTKVTTLMAMPSAKGLFHRGIAQSGFGMRGMSPSDATKSSELLLSKLGLKANQMDEFQKIPIRRLLAAMASTTGLRIGAVVDGKSLPSNQWDPSAPELSANVPLMVGSVETEMTFGGDVGFDPLTDAELHERVKEETRADDAGVNRVIAAYKRGRPNASNLDLYFIIGSDSTRQTAITVAERKFAQGKAPVYMYYFTWRSPVRDGRIRTPHCMEIPFVFDNVDMAKSMTGSGPEQYALADKVSNAWVAFARSGNPSHKGIPAWAPYNTNERATMILDNQCKAVNDPYREELLALNSVRRGGGPGPSND